jgi:hypothetical protein
MNWADLRQKWFRREFRIECCGASALAQQLSVGGAAHGAPEVRRLPQENAPKDATLKERKLAIDVGTALWRLRQRMVDPETGQPPDESRKALRHVEAMWNALRDVGIEIQDHTHLPFRSGLALDVVAFQPIDGLSRDTVIETIRPSIYLNDQVIQVGQVVVGTPPGASSSPQGSL